MLDRAGDAEPNHAPGREVRLGCDLERNGERHHAVVLHADPNTGAAVYDSTPYCLFGNFFCTTGWYQVGGTSLAAPLIAAVYALAGNGAATTYGSFPYSNASSLYDVTSGSNGSYLCTAGPGYDGPTGLGTPIGTGGF